MTRFETEMNPTAIGLSLLYADLEQPDWFVRMGFQPLNDVIAQADGSLTCEGTDPQFSLYPLGRLTVSGWVKLNIDFDSDVNISPIIYAFDGQDRTLIQEIRLGRMEANQSNNATVYFTPKSTQFRFDPADFPCTLTKLSITLTKPDWQDIYGVLRNDLKLADMRDLVDLFHEKSEAYLTSLSNTLGRPQRDTGHEEWKQRFTLLSDKKRKVLLNAIQDLVHKPKISVVMAVYNTKHDFLVTAIDSVLSQIYTNFELCIVDDASSLDHIRPTLEAYALQDNRVRLHFRNVNGNICQATNDALKMCSGSWIVFFDHDDILAEQCLAFIAIVSERQPNVKLIYSDEEKVDEKGVSYDPYFKPDWNRELLLNSNYINHVCAFRNTGEAMDFSLRLGFEGSQDYDLLLRKTATMSPCDIFHLPYILYSWRVYKNSESFSQKRARRTKLVSLLALNDYIMDQKIDGEAVEDGEFLFRLKRNVPDENPLVSILIPTRDRVDLLKSCIQGCLNNTAYQNMEIIIINNNSIEQNTLQFLNDVVLDQRVRVLNVDGEFNYSKINNIAVDFCKGTYLCLLNNDIEVIHDDWLSELVAYAVIPDVGAVGARLLYADRTLQHAGVITGLGGVAGHSHKHRVQGDPGYFRRVDLVQEVSAVTAACLLCSKEHFVSVGGLDEVNLKVAFNDVDLCLELGKKGLRNIYNPHCTLLHLESVSRGPDTNPEKKLRFESEVAYMKKKWGAKLLNDPSYNPNLTIDREDFSVSWHPRIHWMP